MLEVLRKTSESVFVPLTIGGGIRDMVEDGVIIPALEVAGEYFRSGADKVSIGSDAVYATEDYLNGVSTPNAISEISRVYGKQAVVISVDPKRIYVSDINAARGHELIETSKLGPNNERFCWYQCTVRGGREGRDIDVKQLVKSTIEMGAGEILLNCMDHDGQNQGYDVELISFVKSFSTVPVIASSGAGNVHHFSKVFSETNVESALAAGIFHRKEVKICDIKHHLIESGYEVRQ